MTTTECTSCTVETTNADRVCNFCADYHIEDEHGPVTMTACTVWTVPAYRDDTMDWLTASGPGRVAAFIIARGTEVKKEIAVDFGGRTEFIAVEVARDLKEALEAAIADVDDCTVVFSDVESAR